MTAKERHAAYRARLQERLERAAEDADYTLLRQRADMPYDQAPAMTLREMATALAYIEWPYSVHVDRLQGGVA